MTDPGRPAPPPLHDRCAVFLDVDGTLLEIAPSPEAVQVAPSLPLLLLALRRRLGGAVALISGRSISDVDRLFPGMRLPIAGQHGCERRDAQGTVHLHAAQTATLVKLRNLFTTFARSHPGLLLEDKGATLALHYRQAPHLAATVHRTMEATVAAAGAATSYRLQPGKCLLELRPDGRDKGEAIKDFMAEQPFRDRCPVFIGDDSGDEHGFRYVERRGGWSVKVGAGSTLARYRLPDVAAVLAWLSALVPPPSAPSA